MANLNAVDVDGDGDLDFFLPNYSSGNGNKHALLRNDGGWGNFVDAATMYGITDSSAASLGAAFGDWNGDGVPDLPVEFLRGSSSDFCFFRLSAAHFTGYGIDAHSRGVLCDASTGMLA